MANRKWQVLAAAWLGLLVVSMTIQGVQCAPQVQGFGVQVGDWVEYELQCQQAFIAYERGFKVTVTRLEANARAFGTIVYNSSLDRVMAPFSNADPGDYEVDAPLAPFVVRNTSWTTGDFLSPFVEAHWASHVTGQETVYNEVVRDVANFTVEDYMSRNHEGDYLRSDITYIWDNQTGVLCEWIFEITNLNQTVLSGTYGGKMKTTSAWELTTGAIPGYPVTIVLVMLGGATLLATWVVHRKQPSGRLRARREITGEVA